MKLFSIGLIIVIIGFIWNICETLVFIIEYGWHYHAINSAECKCDIIFAIVFCAGCLLMFFGLCKMCTEK